MARPSRQQRRDRRAAQEPALAGAGAPPATPPARRTARGGEEPERRPRPQRSESNAAERRGPIRFIEESWAALKTVAWPDQKAVISGTTVVLIACIIVGTYLWLNDELWKYVVKHVLLQ
jgi:preprotein translocase SecE subunit